MTATPTPLIVNPAAGGGRAGKSAERASAILHARGVDVLLRLSRDREETRDLADRAASEGLPHVLVCGGDGTTNAAANGIAHSDCALGIIPAGRGNDLARAVGLPPRDVDAANTLADLLLRQATPETIDLGQVDDVYFCTVAAFGLDAAVSQRMNAAKVRRGRRLQYFVSAVAEAFRYRPHHAVVTGDFGVREFDIFVCATANSPNYGGLYRIAPDASLTDGLLDVCMAEAVPPFEALRLTLHAIRGTHVFEPNVQVLRTRELRIESSPPHPLYADGELLGRTPVTVRVAPRALRILAAPRPPAV